MESFTVTPTLDQSVASRLRLVARRLRGYVLVEGVARLTGFLLAAAALQLLLDYGTRGLRLSMRAALLGVLVVTAAWLFWRRVLSPLRVRVGLAEVAALVERRYPQLCSLLISSVRFSAGEVGPPQTNSPSLVASTIARSQQLTGLVDFKSVLDPRRARWSVAAIAGVLAIGLLTTRISPELTSLWFARNILLQDIDWPRQTRLIVDLPDGELVAARGDDVVIEATAEGVQPREVEFFFETVGGKRGRETMATVGSRGSYRYRHTLKNAREDLTFYLKGGDDRTDLFSLRLVDRPRVQWSRMHIVPPAYARLESLTLGNDQRTARILPGTRVTIRMETSKPVVQATMMADRREVARAQVETDEHSDDKSQSLEVGAARDISAVVNDSRETHGALRFAVTVQPEETHTYHFAMVDEQGLENRQPVRFSLRILEDEAPRVRLRLTGVGEMVTPDAILPIGVEFNDTYGLATAELVHQLEGDQTNEALIPLPTFRPGTTNFATSLSWALTTISASPGNRLTLFARASDFDDVSGPNRAQSPQISMRVVTKDELLAELARREQEYRMDFERLVEAQEQLRGRLLTALGRFNQPDGPEQLAATLAPLERRQRNIAGSVNVLRQQFEQILTELRINQLATTAAEQRLGEGIVDPFTQLGKRDLVIAADALRQWARDASPETGSTIDPQQVALLSQMRQILANMLQWEGYQEAVTMLRDVLRLQAELRDETKSNLQDRAGDVFDD